MALVAGVGVLAGGCAGDDGRLDLLVGTTEFRVELAVTPEQRNSGLMFREQLGERQGMLFVFEEEKILTFWMRNTSLPLSIAFIDERGTIVHLTDMEPYSEAPVASRHPARFALEVNRGAFARAGVGVGDVVMVPESLR